MSPSDSTGDAIALVTALRTMGLACEVEGRGALAILTARGADAPALLTADARREVLDAARGHGFTHVAVELDASRARTRAAVLRD